jgi:hypothetical protein
LTTLVPAPFICGVPRSGTTLLRLMLDAHPEMAIPPETHFAPRLIRTLDGATGDEARARAHALITEHPRWPDFGLDAGELRARFDAADPFDAAAALRCFFGLYAAGAGKPRWGDKSPKYVRRMRLLHATLPEARFIHVIRDGRAVALSLAGVSWGPETAAEAADRWVGDIERARKMARRLPDYIEVRYEALVADPEPDLRRACELCELDWDDSMLDFHQQAAERMSESTRDLRPGSGGTVTAEERARQHELVSRPPSADRVERWREEMPAEDVAAFEDRAGPLLRELGYG